jgi:acyl-coenzyme A thioesterase 13
MIRTSMMRLSTLAPNPTRDHVAKVLTEMKTHGGFDKVFASSLSLSSACSKGAVVAQFKVNKEHLNRTGRLHGGAICYLVDAVGSLSVAAFWGTEFTGVSTDLHTSFVRGI